MARRILAIGFFFAIAIGAAVRAPWLTAIATEQKPVAHENYQAPAKSIGLRVSRHVAFAGQQVQLRSVVDREADIEVGTVSFSVTRIGFFHRRLGKMVFSDDAIGTSVFPEEAFEGLSTRQGSHGLSRSHFSHMSTESKTSKSCTIRPAPNGTQWSKAPGIALWFLSPVSLLATRFKAVPNQFGTDTLPL